MSNVCRYERFSDGYTVQIIHEDGPANPRQESDNLGMITAQQCSDLYAYADETIRDTWDEWYRCVRPAVVVPLYSGPQSLIAGDDTDLDPDAEAHVWVARETLVEWFGWRRVTEARREQIEGYLKGEIAEYAAYLEGDVVGYVVTGPNGEEVESCWGFYGDHETPWQDACAAVEEDRRERHDRYLLAMHSGI